MSEDTQTQQPAPAAGPNLTIADLVLTAQIIQLGAQRGIFTPEQFTPIGDYYTRLVSFLESAGAITRAAPPAPAPSQPEETPNA